MECKTCFKDWISCGETSLQVLATLLPDTNYTAVLTSPQGAKYLTYITTDANGIFVIEEPGAGLWNPYSGPWTLEVQTANCNKELFNDSAYCDPYACIEFEIVNGNGGKNTIGCPCLEDIEGCCYPEIVSFENISTLDIPYTADMVLKYGDIPTVQVWIYDAANRLTNINVSISFDGNPTTLISIDFGGNASGVVVIK